MAESWREVAGSEEAALGFIFTDKFKQKQMLTELRPKEIVPLSVVGLHRRLYKSQVLQIFEDEIFTLRKSLDRKGELAAAEILASRKRSMEDEENRGGGSL